MQISSQTCRIRNSGVGVPTVCGTGRFENLGCNGKNLGLQINRTKLNFAAAVWVKDFLRLFLSFFSNMEQRNLRILPGVESMVEKHTWSFKASSLSLLSARGACFLIAQALPACWDINPVEPFFFFFWSKKKQITIFWVLSNDFFKCSF